MERKNTRAKETLFEAKGEIERLKAEFLKYDLQNEKRKLDIDNQKLDVEKEFTHLSQNKRDGMDKLNQDANSLNKK